MDSPKDDSIDFNITDKMEENEEEVPDCFLCCICLDLLYKPIILSCGHMSCFWCVHGSMNGARESSCPICRHPYLHFPSICQMLHFLLIKMYPIAYKRRENQMMEEEKRMNIFSPQFDAHPWDPHPTVKANFDNSSQAIMVHNLDHRSSKNFSLHAESGHSESGSRLQSTSSSGPDQDPEQSSNMCTMAPEQKSVSLTKSNESCRTVMISDLLCSACKELLFRPVALNCGHVYCESCIIHWENGKLKCQECQILHPGGLPKVCLEVDHFVEEQLPEEYNRRKSAIQPRRSYAENPSTETGPNKNDGKNCHSSWFTGPGTRVHTGVGCDYCGMFPIIGDRYRCKDCVEKIGFDLCGGCYNSRSKLPGRFNQQHKPEHRFKLVNPNFIRHFMRRLISGQLVTGPPVFFTLDNDSASAYELDPEYQEFLRTHAEILNDTQGSREQPDETSSRGDPSQEQGADYQEFLLTRSETSNDTQGSRQQADETSSGGDPSREHDADYQEFLLTHAEILNDAQGSREQPDATFSMADPSHEHDPSSS